ncbi:hypothetical protein DF268_08575 [Streptomyces sp. V2]|uniref:hypothetical protein n=1 Tax=Streptomyces sp. V2 TaxID=1424099 RepID=UPI000D66F184|nr:hypothetical protein [Streptomyces sp. V2]PWG13911.1 hypothetical protein DF268_08575 [Streptomyces sp. V2]
MPQTPSAAPWPDSVIARYLTVAGAAFGREDLAVDVTYSSKSGLLTAACHGCGNTEHTNTGGSFSDSPEKEQARIAKWLPTSKQDAQTHAEKCRALPRPEA